MRVTRGATTGVTSVHRGKVTVRSYGTTTETNLDAQNKKLRHMHSQDPPPYAYWSVSTTNTGPTVGFVLKLFLWTLTAFSSNTPTYSNSMTFSSNSFSGTTSSSSSTIASVRSPGEDRRTRQIRLATNAKEREQYDHLANLYSIIRTVELLEKCWSSNVVPSTEYVLWVVLAQ